MKENGAKKQRARVKEREKIHVHKVPFLVISPEFDASKE